MMMKTMVLGGALAFGLTSVAGGTPKPAPIPTAGSLVVKVQCARSTHWLNPSTLRCEPIPNDAPVIGGQRPTADDGIMDERGGVHALTGPAPRNLTDEEIKQLRAKAQQEYEDRCSTHNMFGQKSYKAGCN